MKLLFDQNLSPKLVKHLADLYPDSNHVYHLGIDLVPDEEMREYARREGFVIVTKDSDFSDLCILLGVSSKSHLDTSWELQQQGDRSGASQSPARH